MDDEPDVLDLLREEILEACMGVRGFDLLPLAKVRNFPGAVLTAYA